METNLRDIFLDHLDLVDRVTTSVCRRHRCFGDEADEFAAEVKLKLVDNNYAVLAKFRGKSSLATYLTTVIHNLFRDYRIAKWGKWRPSAAARRLGQTAVQLETLIGRDGLATAEAIETLITSYKVREDRDTLFRLAEQLPHRIRRVFESSEALENMGTSDGVERRLEDRDRAAAETKTEAAMAAAMQQLDPDDRLLLRLRFQEGLTVAQIASSLHLKQRPLYTRFEKTLRLLRSAMEKGGVSTDDVRALLGWERSDLKIEYGSAENTPTVRLTKGRNVSR